MNEMTIFEIRPRYKVVVLSFLGFASLLLFPGQSSESRADVPETQKLEIKHLLDFLSHSGCRMERNGHMHDTQEAVNHIVKKYNYYKDNILTTEDFIDRSASRSSLSGRAYHALCPGKETRPTADWLNEELERYRKQRKGS